MADIQTPRPTQHDWEGAPEAFRHASIAETQDPNIGTEDAKHERPPSNRVPPWYEFLASEITEEQWRIFMGGAYNPSDTDVRFSWEGAVSAAGAGVVSILVPPVSAGSDWMVEAITYVAVAGAGVGACTRIDSTVAPSALVDVATAMVAVGNGQFAALSQLNNPLYVPQGRQLVVQFNATGAADFFTRIIYRLKLGEPVKEN